jgi:hypothetical protein
MEKNQILERCQKVQRSCFFRLMTIDVTDETLHICIGNRPHLSEASLFIWRDGSIDAPPLFWTLLNEAEKAAKDKAKEAVEMPCLN